MRRLKDRLTDFRFSDSNLENNVRECREILLQCTGALYIVIKSFSFDKSPLEIKTTTFRSLLIIKE